MDKNLFQPLSGFRDLISPEKERLIMELKELFGLFGYQPLETPAIEREEILLSHYGEEAQKLLYLFKDNGERAVGLRYDLTVPLSRYLAANYQSMPLPFKRYEIGPVWRAEKPQKGRYRQFYQADIDIVGVESSIAEQELLSVIALVRQKFELPMVCRLNDRRVVGQAFEKIGIESSQQGKLLQLLDKKEKINSAELIERLGKVGLNDVQLRQVSQLFLAEANEASEIFEDFLGDSAELEAVTKLTAYAKSIGLMAEFWPSMVRGLDYYTGTILECVLPEYQGGTLISGGRYDSLIEALVGVKLPAVGISFGVDRLLDALENQTASEQPLFLLQLPETKEQVAKWANQLREKEVAIELYLDEAAPLAKQIKYADKRGFKKILIPFEKEWRNGEIVEKDLVSGTQRTIKRDLLGT